MKYSKEPFKNIEEYQAFERKHSNATFFADWQKMKEQGMDVDAMARQWSPRKLAKLYRRQERRYQRWVKRWERLHHFKEIIKGCMYSWKQ